MSKTKKASRKSLVLNVTKEDYNKEVAAGVEEEFRLKPGRHQFRPAPKAATRKGLSVRERSDKRSAKKKQSKKVA